MTSNNPFVLPWKISTSWVPAIVFGLGILLLLPAVWAETSVTGQDEYWLSLRTPMEMNDHGEWLTPWVNGKPRLQKPPLLYWAILLNYKLFGVHLLSARIWGVLSGAGLAVCACLFSRELFGRNGLLAGLLALATMGVAVQGRQAMLDLPCALFSTLAVLCFVKWLKSCSAPGLLHIKTAQGHLSTILLSAFLLGLSFLTKGPVGFLFFTAGVLAFLIVFKPGSVLVRNWWQMVLGMVILGVVCLPWPLAMRHLRPELFSSIMGEELAGRQFGHWTPGSPLSAWSGALGLVLPWTPLMVAAIYSHFRRTALEHLRERRFLLGWFLLAAVPFFFMKSFERYMLALLPAQIVLCADWLEERQPEARAIVLRICVLLLAVISLVICCFAGWFKLALWEIIICMALTGFTVFLAFRSAHPHWVAFCCALLFTVALGGVYPRFGINALPEHLPAELAASPVRLFNSPQPSLLSMRLGRSLQLFDANSPPSATEMVLVDGAHRQQFFELLEQRQLQAADKGDLRTFYSRGAWVRFARPDATREDWKAAFRARSLEGLKSEFHYYLVSLKERRLE